MELWIEGSIDQVEVAIATGIVQAVATNPAIMARWTANGQSMEQVVTEACRRVNVPIYVQLHGPNVDHYLREMDYLRGISDQIHPKLVSTLEGISAAKRLMQDGYKPLITTISTVNQAFMAAAAGVPYIAPYVGRIADAGVDVARLLENIANLYVRHGVQTKIAAASIRTPEQAEQALLAGSHIIVTQYEVFTRLFDSELSQNWIDRFEENWRQFSFAGRVDEKVTP